MESGQQQTDQESGQAGQQEERPSPLSLTRQLGDKRVIFPPQSDNVMVDLLCSEVVRLVGHDQAQCYWLTDSPLCGRKAHLVRVLLMVTRTGQASLVNRNSKHSSLERAE